MSTKHSRSEATAPFGNRLSTPATLSLLLALLVVVLYWPATEFEFSHFDDQTYYTENENVQGGLCWDGVVWAFRTGTASNWHPLTWLSLMVDADLGNGKADAWMPHFTNILLHALDSALLFLLLLRATGAKWRSLLVAGLFAAHPLNVESVAWVAERKNMLSQLFFFISLLAYVGYVQASQIQNPKTRVGSLKAKQFYGASLGAFALALMSKPMVVTMPFVLLLLDVWPLNRMENNPFKVAGFSLPRLPLREKWPFFVLSLLGCVVTYLVQQHGNAVQSSDHFPLPGRIENALVAYLRYLGKTVWPVNLTVFYPYATHWPAALVWLAVVLAGLISLAAAWRWRQSPYFLTGWFWFLGTLVPVIGLIQVGTQSMADRYAYLPLIGIFIVAVWGGFEILNWVKFPRPAMFLAGGASLIVCTLMARHQLNYWQNDGTLFSHALAVTQNNAQAEVTLGVYLEKVKQPAEAAKHYRAALIIDPNDKTAHYDLAGILDDAGQTETAIHEYREAIRCEPELYPIYYNFGLMLERMGRREEAIAQFKTALQIKPDLDVVRQQLQTLGAGTN